VSAQVVDAVQEAFVSALGTGLTIGAATTVAGAALAWVLIAPVTPRTQPEQALSTEEAAPEVVTA
jgi:hypothetical protein